MFRILHCSIFAPLVLLFFTPTNVFGSLCNINQTSCGPQPANWCCSRSLFCGTSYNSCISYRLGDSGDYSTTAPIAIISFVAFFCCSIGLKYYCRSNAQQQQQQTVRRVTPTRPVRQTQSVRNAPVVTHPSYGTNAINTVTPIHYVYEEPPPSYEVATRGSQKENSSAGTLAEANLRV